MNRQFSSPTRAKSNHCLPRLEVLEERRLLACTVFERAGVLTILGDSRANQVQIEDDGTSLTVTCDGQVFNASANVTKVHINTWQGDDNVGYNLTGDLTASRRFLIALQNGNDTFQGSLNGNLNSGANLLLWVTGGNNDDTLDFVAEGADVAEGATLTVRLDGNNSKDTISARFNSLLAGTLNFCLDGGNANDTLTADVTVAAGSTGKLNGWVLGGNGPDQLEFTVQDNSGDDGDPNTTDASTLSQRNATLDGGLGPDSYSASDFVRLYRVEQRI